VLRSWHLAHRSDKTLADLARMSSNVVQGWINYYGRSCQPQLYPPLRRISDYLVKWACRKFKRLRRRENKARELLAATARRYPSLFAHWRFGVKPDGRTMGAV
jgi:RNA-directed DNA polymerase